MVQGNNIPVFITGPTPYPNSFWRNRVGRKINTAFDVKLPSRGVPFSYYDNLTDQQGNLLTTGDGIHLSLHGHNFLARFLSDALCPWIKKIVTQAPATRKTLGGFYGNFCFPGENNQPFEKL